MIAAEGVSVRLDGATVLAGVSVHVPQGTWTTVIGPNGAGKTTLLRAVAGLVPYAGEIVVRGADVRALRPAERARGLALVPQQPLLPPDMTVGEYALLGRTPHLPYLGRPGPRDREVVEAVLARMDLGGLGARRLGALSGGERQRAVLARALAQDAPVLLLDEPTTAMDVGRQQDALELVAALRAERGLTVLGAMHDLTLAGQYADRLVLLDEGRVVAEGPPADVLDEALIARHYRARVRVLGSLGVVVPWR